MSSLDKAVETQLKNIQTKTGKSLAQLGIIMKKSGLTKHGELRAMFIRELGLGYGDANALVHALLQSDGTRAAKAKAQTPDDVVDEIYAGQKASLRPVHERLMAAIEPFGPFEVVPKKGYLSLRRKKQFAMLGPVTKTRVEVGINMKGLPAGGRLVALPSGSMCNYKVGVADPAGVDAQLIGWLKQAYDNAG
jgi:hypothetical protein